MTINGELPQRLRQRITASASVLTTFLNSKKFITVNMLPQGTSFTAASLADTVTISLASRHPQHRGDIAHRTLGLYFDCSKCYTVRHVQEQMAVSMFTTPCIHPI
jgi:hypothetical protein